MTRTWRLGNAVAALFGIAHEDRETTLRAMLASGRGPAAGYWLQLATASVIATLGLALGSSAVVIGAMLVSPLMTPIINLGMGLAVGSPLLVIRSSIRVAASCAIVVAGAALLVAALPFQEVTAEISARTSPTALDLAIASCCAIAGLYAVIRPGSDTASTAAGTAIGIALVPPLCVVGFGLGTATLAIANGAALLFIANFCAIVFFSLVGFLLFGYGIVDITRLERAHSDELAPTRLSGRLAHRLSALFASRASAAVRIAMPLALLVLVFFPLRTALAEVAWEVRVRRAVQEALATLPADTVQSVVRIERRRISVRVVAIGDASTGAEIRANIRGMIQKAVPDVLPKIDVTMVADSSALSNVRATAIDPVPPLPGALHCEPRLSDVNEAVTQAMRAWPVETSGRVLAWHMAFAKNDGAAIFSVMHLGPPLDAQARETFEKAISSQLGASRLVDVALSTRPIESKDVLEVEAWLARADKELTRAAAFAISTDELSACIRAPDAADASAVDRVRLRFAADPRARVDRRAEATWSFRWSTSGCANGPDAAPPAESGGASTPDAATPD